MSLPFATGPVDFREAIEDGGAAVRAEGLDQLL